MCFALLSSPSDGENGIAEEEGAGGAGGENPLPAAPASGGPRQFRVSSADGARAATDGGLKRC